MVSDDVLVRVRVVTEVVVVNEEVEVTEVFVVVAVVTEVVIVVVVLVEVVLVLVVDVFVVVAVVTDVVSVLVVLVLVVVVFVFEVVVRVVVVFVCVVVCVCVFVVDVLVVVCVFVVVAVVVTVVTVVVGSQSGPPETMLECPSTRLALESWMWHPPSGNHTKLVQPAEFEHRIWQSPASMVSDRLWPDMSTGLYVQPFLKQKLATAQSGGPDMAVDLPLARLA